MLIYLNKSTSINFEQDEEIETNDENLKFNDELLDRDKLIEFKMKRRRCMFRNGHG